MPNRDRNHQVGLTLASQDGMTGVLAKFSYFRFSSWVLKGIGYCLAIGISGWAFQALAQGSNAASSSLNVTAVKSQTVSASPRSSNFSLGLSDDSFVASPEELNGVSNFTTFSLGVHPSYTGNWFAAALDARAALTPSVPNYNAYQVPQAYIEAGNVGEQDGVSVAIGRKTETWSELDERWKLGLVQPTFHWNPLHPVEQGLTGAFFNIKTEHFKLVLFGSDLYVPSQGPSLNLQDGHFSSANPYASAPPPSLVTDSSPGAKVYNVQYNIDMPAISSVVTHPSGGMIAEISEDPKGGAWGRASYLRAPRNDLSLPIEGHFQILANDATHDVYTAVSIAPQVVYHEVASVEAGYRTRIVSVSFDALTDHPDQPNLPSDYTYQVLSDQILLSPTLTINTAPSYYWNPKLTFSYLKQYGGATSDRGEFAAQNKDLFADPMIFHEALSFTVSSNVYRRARQRVDLSLQTIEELQEQGTIFLAEGRYHPSANWAVSLGTDILTSNAPESAQTFISRFRGNDLVYAGLEYAF